MKFRIKFNKMHEVLLFIKRMQLESYGTIFLVFILVYLRFHKYAYTKRIYWCIFILDLLHGAWTHDNFPL